MASDRARQFMVRHRCGVVAAMLLGAAGCAGFRARGAPYDSFIVRSARLGENRQINVYTPPIYREQRLRLPVLFMPDGGIDEDFPHVVRAVDSLVRAGAIAPHIVVGIPNTERRRDLTGPTRIKSDSSIAPHVGGSAAFRAFIRDELFPAIDARYRTTNDRAIVGESLAGLFVVETFLRDPAMFDRYVAFDPSLWWNGGALVDSAAGLLSETTDGAPASRLFIAASSDDIGDQTTRFATILHRAAPKDLAWLFESHPELTHPTIFSALECRSLAFALR